MKQAQILAFLLAAAMAVLSASCGAERPQPSSADGSDAESRQTQIATTADGAGSGAGKTTAAGEPSAAPTDDRETENGTQPTQPDDAPSVPPAALALEELPYWDKADRIRVFHTQSPPFAAVTLQKGTKEYETLLSLLKEVKGAYLGISHEGLYGGFMSIDVYQGETKLDRISVEVARDGEDRFSTDTQTEKSKNGLVNRYASLYAMPKDVHDRLCAFLKTLDYTEKI